MIASSALPGSFTDIIIPALIISVEPTNPTDTPDEEPRITAESLSCALPVSHSLSDSANSKIPPALIIRTLPNDPSKREALWSGNHPPFIEPSAMRLIRDAGVRHLLVDLPSVDPEQDEHLTSHRIFWGLPPTGPVEADPTDGRTITEMIFVPDEVADGLYDITIQIPPFALDAAPSRVLIVG